MSIIAPELDFASKKVSHGTYILNKIVQQSGLETVVLSNASFATSIFEIPPDVINLSKSILSFVLTPSAPGNGNSNWLAVDGVPAIRQANTLLTLIISPDT